MRDILFRGKSKKHDKWIYGDYVKNRGFDFVVPRRFVSQEETWEDFEIVPETLGQAIGVCDVTGKNIYEGDKIVSGERDGVFCVVYNAPSFEMLDEEGMLHHLLVVVDETLTVVGNVHDDE